MGKEQHIQRLLTTEGFIQAFWEMCSEYPGCQEKAYEAVDEMYADEFGTRKYSGFNSFRTVMYNFLKKKRNATK